MEVVTTKPKRQRKTEEQKLIEQAEKDERKRVRIQKRELKASEKEQRKADREMSETDMVQRYAKRVIANQGYHGRVDGTKFSGMVDEAKTVNKKLWMDTDFYFSVVFQSSEQKNQFLREYIKKLGLDVEESKEGGIQIVNGMKLAKSLGIELRTESSKDYPLPDIDLREFVLDNAEL